MRALPTSLYLREYCCSTLSIMFLERTTMVWLLPRRIIFMLFLQERVTTIRLMWFCNGLMSRVLFSVLLVACIPFSSPPCHQERLKKRRTKCVMCNLSLRNKFLLFRTQRRIALEENLCKESYGLMTLSFSQTIRTKLCYEVR